MPGLAAAGAVAAGFAGVPAAGAVVEGAGLVVVAAGGVVVAGFVVAGVVVLWAKAGTAKAAAKVTARMAVRARMVQASKEGRAKRRGTRSDSGRTVSTPRDNGEIAAQTIDDAAEFRRFAQGAIRPPPGRIVPCLQHSPPTPGFHRHPWTSAPHAYMFRRRVGA